MEDIEPETFAMMPQQRRAVRLGEELLELRNGFVADHQDAVLEALTATDGVHGPASTPQVF